MTTEKSPHLLLKIAFVLATAAGALLLLWAFGALWYDLSIPATGRKMVAFMLAIACGLLWFGGRRKGRIMAISLIGLVMVWWFTLKPRSDRPWQPDVARTASAEIQGDVVIFHNVRNCDYRTETDYTPRWETRTVRLSNLTGVDMALTYWGSPYMAHPIMSFQFSDAPPLCFSIETRKEIGESYSSIGGFFRQYELIYVVADERDVVRLRTNFRTGEDVYLYRLNLTPEQVRERFMDYVTALNKLHAKPHWYNAATTNCTTAIRTQHAAKNRAKWDWRILVNGKGDEMLYERGALKTGGLSFPELKHRSHINPLVRSAAEAPDYSTIIRSELPPDSRPPSP